MLRAPTIFEHPMNADCVGLFILVILRVSMVGNLHVEPIARAGDRMLVTCGITALAWKSLWCSMGLGSITSSNVNFYGFGLHRLEQPKVIAVSHSIVHLVITVATPHKHQHICFGYRVVCDCKQLQAHLQLVTLAACASSVGASLAHDMCSDLFRSP